MVLSSKDGAPSAVSVVDRHTGAVIPEIIPAVGLLRLAYLTPLRKLARASLFKYALFSRLIGWYADRRASRRAIPKAVVQLGLNCEEFAQPLDQYRSFNDFFTRSLKPEARQFAPPEGILVSPADCRLLVFPEISRLQEFPVKGVRFAVDELLQDHDAAAVFEGGALALCRLAPADCHRFYFPAAGHVQREWAVPGRYDSVNTLVMRVLRDVFTRNVRRIALLELEQFGPAAFVEVGAFAVSRIRSTHEGSEFAAMDEKGYFQLGGSTIILLLTRDQVVFDRDLIENSNLGYETLIQAGDRIGQAPVR